MGQTMAEKILARCSTQVSTKAGDIVMARVNCAMMDDILGPRIFDAMFKELGGKIKHPETAVIICDHYTPPATIQQANIVEYTRRWAKEHAVKNYFEGLGPCHQILAEKGFSLPGTLQVGTDSHTCTAGAFGCFGTGIGSSEMAGVLATGKIWLRVPESIKVCWTGDLPPAVMAKDIILKTIGTLGHGGATYKALEFCGNTIEALSMDERMCIANMAVESGAKAGLIAADETTYHYLREHGCHDSGYALQSDANAVYVQTLGYRAQELSPQVACPHEVDNVHPISEVMGIPIHQAYLGSCTGGRLHDLETAANILRGKRIADGCRLLVSPSSKSIWNEAEKRGILAILSEAGATILAPTCGACLGVHSGLIADGEVCVSTTNRNFKGRMGSKDSFVYLASPATLAASAIEGRLADPREYCH